MSIVKKFLTLLAISLFSISCSDVVAMEPSRTPEQETYIAQQEHVNKLYEKAATKGKMLVGSILWMAYLQWHHATADYNETVLRFVCHMAAGIFITLQLVDALNAYHKAKRQ